ncbi:MAG: hypothetical protein ACRDSE_20145, partial [Pseudonocardiaceae bacterium]
MADGVLSRPRLVLRNGLAAMNAERFVHLQRSAHGVPSDRVADGLDGHLKVCQHLQVLLGGAA